MGFLLPTRCIHGVSNFKATKSANVDLNIDFIRGVITPLEKYYYCERIKETSSPSTGTRNHPELR